MPTKTSLRFYLLATLWLCATVAPAFSQQYNELPPNSVIGNVLGQTNPSFAVSFNELAAQLRLPQNGGLVQGPAAATPGHAVAFGAAPNEIVDAGAISGTGTVTQVTCGPGLSGGTFNVTGTCALNIAITPQLRLTLASGTPVMGTSVPGATLVIVTPYVGNLMPIYDGTNMVPTAFSEVQQATTDATKSPAAVGASQVFDIFCWVDAGTNRCTRGPAWTNSTARGYTLVRVNGILLNNSSITNGPAASRGTWVGTIASNASSTIDYILGGSGSGGVAAVLNVFNFYNRVTVAPQVIDTHASYNYSSATVRQADNSASNQISYVIGAAEDAISASYSNQCSTVATISANCQFGIGTDATSSFAGPPFFGYQNNGATASQMGGGVSYQFMPSLGVHTISANEASDGSHANTFNASSSGTLTASLRM
jgi:hypothetical protein